MRIRVLDGQFVPVGDTENYEKSDFNLWVSCEEEGRGTIEKQVFAVTTLKRVNRTLRGGGQGQAYYNTFPDKKLYPIDDSNPQTPREYINAYEEWRWNGKTPRLTPQVKPVKESKPEAKSKSLLDKLLTKFPIPTPKENAFYVDPVVWNRLLIGIEKRHNLMLQGDSGCGKTELSYLLAKLFDLPLELFDMGSKIDPIASLIGTHRHNTAKGGSYFDRANFTYAIQKRGLVLLDEISRAGALTNNILLSVLDNRKVLQMDLATQEEERLLSVSEECQFISTANVGFEYTGTQALDRALEERFRIVKIDYPPEEIEAEILRLKMKVGKRPSETIVKVASTIRTMNRKGDLSKGVSLRHTLDAAELEAGGFDLKTALEVAFLPSFQYSEEQKVLEVLASR